MHLLAVQGTLKSLLQHHSSKVSILRCSAFFMVQLSYPYMITGKTITLTIRAFVGKVKTLTGSFLCWFNFPFTHNITLLIAQNYPSLHYKLTASNNFSSFNPIFSPAHQLNLYILSPLSIHLYSLCIKFILIVLLTDFQTSLFFIYF